MPGARVYYWLNLVIIPAFAMLSGYISRNFRGTPKEIQRTVSTLVIPYLLVETSYQVLQRHYTGGPDPYMLLSPKWVAWFLSALFLWRLTTPIWRSLRHPIIVAIVISLLVPLTEVPNVFAIPKTLGFLPFYVIGMYMTIDRFERLATVRLRIASAVVLVGVAVACALFAPQWDVSWTKWRHRYGEAALSAGALEGIAHRAVLMVVGMLMSFAIVSLGVPALFLDVAMRPADAVLLPVARVRRPGVGAPNPLVRLAARTWVGSGWPSRLRRSVVLAIALMSKPVAVVFRPLFESNLDWAFRPRDRLAD